MPRAHSSSALAATRAKFIEAGGHTTQSFGVGRIIGQVYALLYLSPSPLCLDDIVTELGVSKASVSTTIRQLEAWSAVKPVWIKGDRRDFYEAELDFRAVMRNGLLGLVRKKLATAGSQLEQAETSINQILPQTENGDTPEEIQAVAERLRRAKLFHEKIDTLLNNPLVERLL